MFMVDYPRFENGNEEDTNSMRNSIHTICLFMLVSSMQIELCVGSFILIWYITSWLSNQSHYFSSDLATRLVVMLQVSACCIKVWSYQIRSVKASFPELQRNLVVLNHSRCSTDSWLHTLSAYLSGYPENRYRSCRKVSTCLEKFLEEHKIIVAFLRPSRRASCWL